jgi:DNA-binding transcriptional LysR family regulator
MPPLDPIGRRLKLHDLNVLMTVVQAGSMGKAAARLNTTQPSVSRSIAELEHALGVRLLDRNRQGVELTIYGRALLDCGTAVLADLDQGVRNIRFLADPTEGELKIGGDSPATAGVIPAAIGRFRRKYPRIDVHVLLVMEVLQQYRSLRERTRELIFGRIAQPLDQDLHAETLFEEGIVVVAGSRNPWTRRRKIKLAELAGERWLLPTLDSMMGSVVVQTFRTSGLEFPPKGSVTGSVLNMYSSLVADGDFLTFFPSSLLRFGSKALRLKVLPVNLPIPASPLGIVRLKDRTLSPIAQRFIDCAREVAKPLAQGR